jgi:ferrochelatase
MSFGGPENMADVVPFLRRVVAGRNVPDDRLAAVAEQYRAFDGVSPLNGLNRELVQRLQVAAPPTWVGERVYLANRNSPPFPTDTFAELKRLGARRVAAFMTSAFSSYSGCRQYRENLATGAAEHDIEVAVLPKFHDHPLLADIWADRVVEAAPGSDTRVVFVTHSLPLEQSRGVVPGVTGYLAQHETLSVRIIERAASTIGQTLDWTLAFQSRSGPPTQPWLEPDIAVALDDAAAAGVSRALVAPIGFCADNLEIRWDLDTVAAEHARTVGLQMLRLAPPQADARFVDMIWELFRRGSGISCQIDCCPNPRGTLASVGEA